MNAKLPATARIHEWRSGAGLGRAVRAARQDAGLSISELARRAGVGRKFLHELEAGKETLRASKVVNVLDVLGLRLSVAPKQARRRESAKAWLRRNRGALNAYNRHIEEDGVFSDGLRSF